MQSPARSQSHVLAQLESIRGHAGPRTTHGLSDEVITRFATPGSSLERAIEEAVRNHHALLEEWGGLLRGPEDILLVELQDSLVNFYP
ncbi:MAG: hypothetical protein QGG40_12540, partial [Myxococcota bacterium]|nr:hypothetical protein [Myxococcota bacterium]